jgi:tRNA threonylcarbamoyladenosine biosynthesis protein TsaB
MARVEAPARILAVKILAIDTALQAVSACVFSDQSLIADASESVAMERGHAEALLPLIDRVVARAEGGFDGLDRVAVTVGPGSFTGLRVGIAAARAIGVACEIPVVGVSTFAALAAPLIMEQKPDVVGVAIDARHGNIFFAAFGPDGRPLLAPSLMSIREAADLLSLEHVRLTGSGAALLGVEAEKAGASVEAISESLVPDIVFVAKLGLLADPALAPPRPLYLKAADAKPQNSNAQSPDSGPPSDQ